jgi:hypothetical protein
VYGSALNAKIDVPYGIQLDSKKKRDGNSLTVHQSVSDLDNSQLN